MATNGDMKEVLSYAIGSVVGAWLIQEFITAMAYSGPGSGIVEIFPFLVIAIGLLGAVNKAL